MSPRFFGRGKHWIASTSCEVCIRSGFDYADYDLKMQEMAS